MVHLYGMQACKLGLVNVPADQGMHELQVIV
jgi:hypothetical protein